MKISNEVCPDEKYDEVDDSAPVKIFGLESTCQEEFDEEASKDLLEYNFKIIGINMLETRTKKSESGVILCEVIIQPTPKEVIKRLGSALRDWKVTTMS